jgi:hypothetical protein
MICGNVEWHQLIMTSLDYLIPGLLRSLSERRRIRDDEKSVAKGPTKRIPTDSPTPIVWWGSMPIVVPAQVGSGLVSLSTRANEAKLFSICMSKGRPNTS